MKTHVAIIYFFRSLCKLFKNHYSTVPQPRTHLPDNSRFTGLDLLGEPLRLPLRTHYPCYYRACIRRWYVVCVLLNATLFAHDKSPVWQHLHQQKEWTFVVSRFCLWPCCAVTYTRTHTHTHSQSLAAPRSRPCRFRSHRSYLLRQLQCRRRGSDILLADIFPPNQNRRCRARTPP